MIDPYSANPMMMRRKEPEIIPQSDKRQHYYAPYPPTPTSQAAPYPPTPTS